ncbi:MAG: type IV secretory system conjugative DNA transfer family protein, partial [Robiginitomaculum sp.]|nr:type IV secretory system conjugative DNA transfer family protein [Robiginitomaculum sp.]
PRLSHVMISRQETARQLITPGEIMQLPASDELILVSGFPAIKAQKVRYYADKNFTGRVFGPPNCPRTAIAIFPRIRLASGVRRHGLWMIAYILKRKKKLRNKKIR